MSWLKDRVKEMSSWSGASLIAFGLLIVLGGPLVELVAYAAIVWGIISIIKNDLPEAVKNLESQKIL